ncbi:hypothetical protein VTK73DRAFT_8252 [Phialemonium thermophilum]|uniref:Uncharacterized protein n=1 Tax=Phialemonium thermophilum TaxID=223376 RepID=A0ABR3XQ36_9PEZI
MQVIWVSRRPPTNASMTSDSSVKGVRPLHLSHTYFFIYVSSSLEVCSQLMEGQGIPKLSPLLDPDNLVVSDRHYIVRLTLWLLPRCAGVGIAICNTG